MRKILVLLSFGFVISAFGQQDVLVKLFSSYSIGQSWVTTHSGDYFLVGTDSEFNVIDTIDDLYREDVLRTLLIKKVSDKVEVFKGGKSFGTYDGVKLITSKQDAHFIIQGKGAERIYNGQLLFRSYKDDFQVINQIAIEPYVAGVVESEGGHVTDVEYFKAQAVLARTWVLKNMNKHIAEGYNVKDNVSSQAYYSKAYLQNSEAIIDAVAKTKDTVLLDSKGELVFGAFHSNSGGQTSNSEDIWSQKIDYLRSVEDPYSIKGSKATWEKKVSKTEFINYFARITGAPASDKALQKAVLTIKMKERKPWFEYNGKKVKMRDVRTKFRLRSSFFSVSELGEYVLLKGKGFGHGVGLSQQGAMEMAREGKSYTEILLFYFKGTHLSSINSGS